MNQSHLDQFAAEHMGRRDEKSGMQTIRAIVSTLNDVRAANGLPVLTHPIPYVDQGGYRFKPDRFKQAFRDDIARAALCLAQIKEPWRAPHPNAYERIELDLLRFASAGCLATNSDPYLLETTHDLGRMGFARASVGFVCKRSIDRNPVKHQAGAYAAAHLVCALAEYHLEINGSDLALLRDLRHEHAPVQVRELSAEKQAIIGAFIHPDRIRELRRLPRRLFSALDSRSNLPTQRELIGALALELALCFGLWPFMLSGCTIRHRNEPSRSSKQLRDGLMWTALINSFGPDVRISCHDN